MYYRVCSTLEESSGGQTQILPEHVDTTDLHPRRFTGAVSVVRRGEAQ